MNHYTVRPLTLAEIPVAAALLARGMQDNPNVIAAIGNDSSRRVKAFTGIFKSVLERTSEHGKIWGAYESETLVGVCAALPPGTCEPNAREKLSLLYGVASNAGLRALPKALTWLGAWAKRDPKEAHWHLGPIAVDFDKQSRGVGRALMEAFCGSVDSSPEPSYLETDKEQNVDFYKGFGFRVITTETVIGVPNWFMLRK